MLLLNVGNSVHWVSQTGSTEEKNYEGAGYQGSGGELCIAVALEMMIGIECLYEVPVFHFTPSLYVYVTPPSYAFKFYPCHRFLEVKACYEILATNRNMSSKIPTGIFVCLQCVQEEKYIIAHLSHEMVSQREEMDPNFVAFLKLELLQAVSACHNNAAEKVLICPNQICKQTDFHDQLCKSSGCIKIRQG